MNSQLAFDTCISPLPLFAHSKSISVRATDSRQTNRRTTRKQTDDRQTDRPTNSQTDRQTRRTERATNRQTDKQTDDRQTDRTQTNFPRLKKSDRRWTNHTLRTLGAWLNSRVPSNRIHKRDEWYPNPSVVASRATDSLFRFYESLLRPNFSQRIIHLT